MYNLQLKTEEHHNRYLYFLPGSMDNVINSDFKIHRYISDTFKAISVWKCITNSALKLNMKNNINVSDNPNQRNLKYIF